VCNLGFFFFWHECQKSLKLHKNELNTTFFCSTSPPKGSKSLKISKISLTFRFDKLSNLSKSVHTGESSQILTVSNKKIICINVTNINKILILFIHSGFENWIHFSTFAQNMELQEKMKSNCWQHNFRPCS
jgi:hypothetical protein